VAVIINELMTTKLLKVKYYNFFTKNKKNKHSHHHHSFFLAVICIPKPTIPHYEYLKKTKWQKKIHQRKQKLESNRVQVNV
jgi:hypothetical protein